MKDEQYFNPFGPNFLTSTLEEDVRLKLLECIKDHSTNMWEDPSVISSYSAQKNSIVDGMLGDIKPEWQDKYHGNIIMKTISKLLNTKVVNLSDYYEEASEGKTEFGEC